MAVNLDLEPVRVCQPCAITGPVDAAVRVVRADEVCQRILAVRADGAVPSGSRDAITPEGEPPPSTQVKLRTTVLRAHVPYWYGSGSPNSTTFAVIRRALRVLQPLVRHGTVVPGCINRQHRKGVVAIRHQWRREHAPGCGESRRGLRGAIMQCRERQSTRRDPCRAGVHHTTSESPSITWMAA